MSTPVVTVPIEDLRAVLAVVPEWVAMGFPGDERWSPESLSAKERLLALIEDAS